MHGRLFPSSKQPSRSDKDPMRVARLGYSVTAMLDEAERNGLYDEAGNLPLIAEALPLFSTASTYLLTAIASQEPRVLERHVCPVRKAA